MKPELRPIFDDDSRHRYFVAADGSVARSAAVFIAANVNNASDVAVRKAAVL